MSNSTHSGNPGLQLEEGEWLDDYNYIRPGESSIRDEAYRNWYETTHPRPYSLDQAIEYYWVNQRRQLQRYQANHPLSYKAFLRANQPTEGHFADDTWDYGQLYRLHMIRAQAAKDIPRLDITEEDVDNYLIRTALSDRQLARQRCHHLTTDGSKKQPMGQKNYHRTGGHLLPSIAENAETNNRRDIERQHCLLEP